MYRIFNCLHASSSVGYIVLSLLVSEEGARFPISMVASGVWAGEISLERAHHLKEVGNGGRMMKQELARIGYLGEMDASYRAMPLGVE